MKSMSSEEPRRGDGSPQGDLQQMDAVSPSELAPTTERPSLRTRFWYAGDELRTVWKLAAFTGIGLFCLFLIALVLHAAGLDAVFAAQSAMMVAALAAATSFGVRVIDAREWRREGFPMDRAALVEFGAGTAGGAGMVGLIVLVFAGGGLSSYMISVVSFTHALRVLAEGTLLFTLVAAGEELMLRGYVFTSLARGMGRWGALATTSVVFGVLHAGNPNVTEAGLANIVLAGVWLGVARMRSGAIWLPIGLHFGWNFALGVVAGHPVSGVPIESVALATHVGDALLTGGMFGPEAGLVASVVLVAGIGVAWRWGGVIRRDPGNPDAGAARMDGMDTTHTMDTMDAQRGDAQTRDGGAA